MAAKTGKYGIKDYTFAPKASSRQPLGNRLNWRKIAIALTTLESALHSLVGNPEGILLKLALTRVTTRIVLREKKL
jgi:hypothetical protein